MKRFFAIAALIFMLVSPFLYAQGAEETVGGVLSGAVSGGAAGAAGGPWAALAGALIGALGGGLAGSAKDKNNEASRKSAELEQKRINQDNYLNAKQNYDSIYENYNSSLTNIDQSLSNINSYDQAILRWQDQYDIGLDSIKAQGQVDYRNVMNNFSDSALSAASMGQSGGTADIISSGLKSQVISLVGDNLKLDSVGGTYGRTLKEYNTDTSQQFEELVEQRAIEGKALGRYAEAAERFGKEFSEAEGIYGDAYQNYYGTSEGYGNNMTDTEKSALKNLRDGNVTIKGYRGNADVDKVIQEKYKGNQSTGILDTTRTIKAEAPVKRPVEVETPKTPTSEVSSTPITTPEKKEPPKVDVPTSVTKPTEEDINKFTESNPINLDEKKVIDSTTPHLDLVQTPTKEEEKAKLEEDFKSASTPTFTFTPPKQETASSPVSPTLDATHLKKDEPIEKDVAEDIKKASTPTFNFGSVEDKIKNEELKTLPNTFSNTTSLLETGATIGTKETPKAEEKKEETKKEETVTAQSTPTETKKEATSTVVATKGADTPKPTTVEDKTETKKVEEKKEESKSEEQKSGSLVDSVSSLFGKISNALSPGKSTFLSAILNSAKSTETKTEAPKTTETKPTEPTEKKNTTTSKTSTTVATKNASAPKTTTVDDSKSAKTSTTSGSKSTTKSTTSKTSTNKTGTSFEEAFKKASTPTFNFKPTTMDTTSTSTTKVPTSTPTNDDFEAMLVPSLADKKKFKQTGVR